MLPGRGGGRRLGGVRQHTRFTWLEGRELAWAQQNYLPNWWSLLPKAVPRPGKHSRLRSTGGQPSKQRKHTTALPPSAAWAPAPSQRHARRGPAGEPQSTAAPSIERHAQPWRLVGAEQAAATAPQRPRPACSAMHACGGAAAAAHPATRTHVAQVMAQSSYLQQKQVPVGRRQLWLTLP